LEGDRVAGVVTELGIRFFQRVVVLTTGTFFRAHPYRIGRTIKPSGWGPAFSVSLRAGASSSSGGRASRPERRPGSTGRTIVFRA